MESFVELHKDLLKEEHEAEIEECSSVKKTLSIVELQNRGICIRKLHIVSLKTGLYGRTIIKLGMRGSHDRPIPSHRFSSGDIVDLHLKQSENLSKPELQGVVTSVKETVISVALDGEEVRSTADDIHSSDKSLLMFKTANEVTYRRLKKGLDRLLNHKGVALPLIEVCFGTTKPTNYSDKVRVLKYYNESLNMSQKEAIEFAMSQRELAVIHGPPGTGKTTTIAELIMQLVTNEQKVLACAPSNVAIDNILEKLSVVKILKSGTTDSVLQPIKIVRLGHPARILSPELYKLSLDALVAKSDAAKIVQDVRKDIDNLYRKFRKKHNKQEQFKMREEKKALSKELREREKKAIYHILSSADVILATNVGAHADGPLKHLPKDHFQVVVIDECAQALEASCWIPLLQAPKCVLAGDHLQLPPTVKSRSAAAKWLSKSLLERIVGMHGKVVRMLNVQYRMNNAIMKWSSDNLYQSKLTSHDSVKHHLLTDLPGVIDVDDVLSPLLLIDTAGCNMPELQTVDSESIGNPGEADLVTQHVRTLIESGINPKDIAVISPYNMQVELLRKTLHAEYKGLEIRSVDGFQGREKEAVVLSLVRSNDKGVVGFLSDDRRTNVAVTRARRHLALICDSLTVGKHKFLKTLIDYMNEHGEVRSAYEFSAASQDDGANFDPVSFMRDVAKWKTKTVQKDKQDLSKIKKQMRDVIQDFVNESKLDSGKKLYEFPSSLKAHERLAVHEVCEEMKLKHESVGDGNDRKIIVTIVENDNVSKVSENNTESETLGPIKSLQSKSQIFSKIGPNVLKMSVEDNKLKPEEKHLITSDDKASLLNDSNTSKENNTVSENNTESETLAPIKSLQSESQIFSKIGANILKMSVEDNKLKPEEKHLVTSDDRASLSNDSNTSKELDVEAQSVSLKDSVGTEVFKVQSSLSVDVPLQNSNKSTSGSIKSTEQDTDLPKAQSFASEIPIKGLISCNICSKKLPPENIQLHQVHCERLKAMKVKLNVAGTNSVKPKVKKQNKTKKKANKTKPDQENDDAILEEAINYNKVCSKEHCKKSMSMLGQVCKFCKKSFCLEHHIPEVHGCGMSAHGAARQQICRDGVLYSGSGVPSKNLPPVKHAHLQRKLGNQLKEMEESRKSSNKKK